MGNLFCQADSRRTHDVVLVVQQHIRVGILGGKLFAEGRRRHHYVCFWLYVHFIAGDRRLVLGIVSLNQTAVRKLLQILSRMWECEKESMVGLAKGRQTSGEHSMEILAD
jgi:hypothetical protein